ncbi:MAG: hypothetical protein BJ554DRAFT_3017, partial [Olpidium bornovanus]
GPRSRQPVVDFVEVPAPRGRPAEGEPPADKRHSKAFCEQAGSAQPLRTHAGFRRILKTADREIPFGKTNSRTAHAARGRLKRVRIFGRASADLLLCPQKTTPRHREQEKTS